MSYCYPNEYEVIVVFTAMALDYLLLAEEMPVLKQRPPAQE